MKWGCERLFFTEIKYELSFSAENETKTHGITVLFNKY